MESVTRSADAIEPVVRSASAVGPAARSAPVVGPAARRQPVVITGVGAVTPLGVGARTMHRRWSQGECGILDGEAPCADFDPLQFLSVKEARRADRFTQLAIAACEEAIAEAGWPAAGGPGAAGDGPYEPCRVGCVLGTGIGGISTLVAGQEILRDRGPERVPPLSIPLMMVNAGAAALSMRNGFRGPSFAVSTACASGAHAIGLAVRMIQSGEADAAIAGGSEAGLMPLARAAFSALDALSVSGISRPFDARRDGFVMGEGAAVLVLERADLARQRGADVLGVVRGYASTSDAHHLTAPDEGGRGQADAMAGAMADAGVEPGEIAYINAHGTSTPLNDRAETLAIKRALGERAASIPISSTKSAIGHLLGAAGAVEAVATLLALSERLAPPTLGFREREEGLDLDYVPGEARPLGGRGIESADGAGGLRGGDEGADGAGGLRGGDEGAEGAGGLRGGDEGAEGGRLIGLSNSFGFGGHNAVLCLEAA